MFQLLFSRRLQSYDAMCGSCLTLFDRVDGGPRSQESVVVFGHSLFFQQLMREFLSDDVRRSSSLMELTLWKSVVRVARCVPI